MVMELTVPPMTLQVDKSIQRQIGLAVKAALDEGFRAFDLGDKRGALFGSSVQHPWLVAGSGRRIS
jgi:hypothetical protein